MNVAQVGADTIAGGGIAVCLATVMTAFLRRTKDTDVRRDEFTTLVITERDRAWAEAEEARAEIAAVRVEYEARLDEQRARHREEIERQRADFEVDRAWLEAQIERLRFLLQSPPDPSSG